MTSREIFELAVRILGAVSLVWGIAYLVDSALFYTEYIINPDVTFRYYLIFGWVDIFISLVLIRAPWILSNFAYPPDDVEVVEEEANVDTSDEKK